MELQLRGGVLLIGSLFWQDHLDLFRKDNVRRDWRNSRLKMDDARDVAAPIRYGRFSGARCYTMTFDHRLPPHRYGVAKVVPFQHERMGSFDEILQEVTHISRAEGPNTYVIKGSDPWCICAMLFHPDLDTDIRNLILRRYSQEMKNNDAGYQIFTSAPEIFSATPEGVLDIPWPEGADNMDFLITASTKPSKRPGASEVTPKEIARFIDGRPYFYENRLANIITFEDEEILKFAL